MVSTETGAKELINKIERILLVALAVSFCTSLTATWICLTLLLIVALVAGDRRRRLHLIVSAPLFWPLLVFCCCIVLAGFAHGGLREALQSVATTRGLLVYLIAYQAYRLNDCRNMLSVLFVCAALSGLFAVIQQLFNFHPFTYPYLQATGFLGDPMSFAGLMQLTSFTALGVLARRWQLKGDPGLSSWPQNNKLMAVIVLANFLGLIFASERSAWLGMLVALPIVFLYISPKVFFRGTIVLAVASILAWSFVPVVKTRLASLAHFDQDVSVKARLVIWSKAWQIFQEHPVLGVGPRNFPSIDMPEAIVPQHSTGLNHAHSNYLQILATTGLVGFCAFFVLLAASLCAAVRQIRSSDAFASGLGLGLLGALLSLSVAGLFEYNFGSGQVKLIQWFLLALLNFQAQPGSRLITPADEHTLNHN